MTSSMTLSSNETKKPEYRREEPLTIERRGTKLIVPETMSLEDVAKWVKRAQLEEEKAVAINEVIETYPLDGALALTKALSFKFGWADMVPTPGFFRDNPPMMIGVEVGLGESVQVPWGRIQMPGVEGFIQTGVTMKDGRQVFEISGTVKSKHKAVVAEIAALTKKYVQEESIYRAKAVRITFPEAPKRGEMPDPSDYDPRQHAPRFMDLRGVNPEDLILPAHTAKQVVVNLFTPVRKTDECRRQKIPLKRGALLAGPYGVGKTMIANILAVTCVNHGWTFIYLKDVSQLRQAIMFAKLYGPAVIFAEDIDQIVGNDARDEATNDLLNTIDGVETKGLEVMIVLTTNHLEKLNPAILRPGRLDAIIQIEPPDAAAAERLVRAYGRNLINKEEDLTKVGTILQGQKPATIREVVERSKLACIERMTPGEVLKLTGEDLETAASGMVEHIKLMDRKPETPPTAVEVLGREIGQAHWKVFEPVLRKILESPQNLRQETSGKASA